MKLKKLFTSAAVLIFMVCHADLQARARQDQDQPSLAVVVIPRTRGVEAERIRIFLSAPVRAGFIDLDQEILDSIRNIRNQLDGSKQIVVVDTKEKADVTLTVVKRGIGLESYRERLTYSDYFDHAELDSTPILKNTIWVTTVMEVGEYKKEFTGGDRDILGAFWVRCAKQITQNLEGWVKSNASQVRQHLASR